MKICFLVPDGVGVKSYLYTDLLSRIKEMGHEVILMHQLAPEVLSEIETVHEATLESVDYQVIKEPFIARFLREACSLARLRFFSRIANNPTIELNWMPKKNTLAKRLFFSLVEKFAGSLKSITEIEKVEDWVFGLLEKSQGTRYYEGIWSRIQPDLIFCTHQRVPEAAFPILAAQKKGIQTVSAIFSWDNLPKARLNIRCDRYMLWSEHMKGEMERFYPNIPPDTMVVSGTPQFDFYSKSSLCLDREDFAARFGLDPGKSWVCFSGDDQVTSPFDPVYLEDMAIQLQQDLPNVQILFREVPTENVERYQRVLENHPNITHIPPLWEKSEKWNRSWPRFEDFSRMSSLAHHCMGIVNVGSTMAHDFAVNGKTSLFINYDVPGHGDWSVDHIYKFQHFRSMDGLDGVGWINSSSDWSAKVAMMMDPSSEIAKDGKTWYNRVNEFDSLGGMEQYIGKLLDF